MKKLFKICLIFEICLIAMTAPYPFMAMLGKGTIFYYGYGIDSSGALYIAKIGRIEKYLDGELIGEIGPTMRGYKFTIQEDDTIIEASGSNVRIWDLSGNEIASWEDDGQTSRKLNKQLYQDENVFVANDGTKYVLTSNFDTFGRAVITSENGDVIFKMPLFDYIVKVIINCAAKSLVILGPLLMFLKVKIDKEEKKKAER